jgi:hypothetical protein
MGYGMILNGKGKIMKYFFRFFIPAVMCFVVSTDDASAMKDANRPSSAWGLRTEPLDFLPVMERSVSEVRLPVSEGRLTGLNGSIRPEKKAPLKTFPWQEQANSLKVILNFLEDLRNDKEKRTAETRAFLRSIGKSEDSNIPDALKALFESQLTLNCIYGTAFIGKKGLSFPDIFFLGPITGLYSVLSGTISINFWRNDFMSLHMICSICGRDVVKVIKLFLCSDDVEFEGGFNVGYVKTYLTEKQQEYIKALQKGYYGHISKHFYGEEMEITVQELDKHNKVKSGFAAVSREFSKGVSLSDYGVAQRMIDYLVINFSEILKDNLRIEKVSEEKELAILKTDAVIGVKPSFAIDASELVSTLSGKPIITKLVNLVENNGNDKSADNYGGLNRSVSDFLSRHLSKISVGNGRVIDVSYLDFGVLGFFFEVVFPYNIEDRAGNFGTFFAHTL